MTTTKKLWIGIVILTLLSPLGLIIPALFGAGGAWGEWGLEEIKKLIDQEVYKVNQTLAQVETIKKVALLPRRFYEEDGDVTPTKKVKRRFVEKHYAELIESLYKERD